MSLRVVTLNTWGRYGPWPSRRARIRDELARLAPDVIGLQEIWQGAAGCSARELLEDLAPSVAYEWYVAPAYEVEPGITCGNAIAARFPLRRTGAIALPAPANDCARNVAHAEAATPWGTLPIFVTHLSWRFHQTRARVAQVQRIAALVTELAPIDGPQLPPVLMGDFNAEPDSDEIRYLRGLTAPPGAPECYLNDCFGTRGDGPGVTFSRINTFAAAEHYPERRIDYIFVRGPDRHHRGEPLTGRVVFDEPGADGVFPSDHFGVLAELRV